jgi:hypothetical protein
MSRSIARVIACLALVVFAIALPASAQTSETFAYDSLGRLTKVTPSSGADHFQGGGSRDRLFPARGAKRVWVR